MRGVNRTALEPEEALIMIVLWHASQCLGRARHLVHDQVFCSEPKCAVTRPLDVGLTACVRACMRACVWVSACVCLSLSVSSWVAAAEVARKLLRAVMHLKARRSARASSSLRRAAEAEQHSTRWSWLRISADVNVNAQPYREHHIHHVVACCGKEEKVKTASEHVFVCAYVLCASLT
jgi:hypothetical protein